MTNKIPDGWKEISLSDLLDKVDTKTVYSFIKNNQWIELRIFLNSIDEKLEQRGVVSDYLYYFLEAKFRK